MNNRKNNNLVPALLLALLSLSCTQVEAVGPGPQKNWSISLTGIGVTLHGVKPGPIALPKLKNKMSKDGRWAYNPQIGVIVRKGYFQGGAILLKDCFDNNAALLGFGPQLQWGYLTVGSLFGAYGRQIPSAFTYYYGDVKHQQMASVALNRLPLSRKMGSMEVAPMVAGTVTIEVPVSKRISLEVNAAANVYLNHANLGLRFNF